MPKIRAIEAAVQVLRHEGVNAAFGVPGAAINPLYAAMRSLGTVYYLVSRKLPFLTSHAVVSGMIFGALVYVFMHYLVLPLSALPKGHASLLHKVTEFIEHWFFVGLPISLSVRHYSR